MVSRGIAAALFCALALAIWAHPAQTLAQGTGEASASGSQGLEEVIVTARRREEKAQTVPIALNTFSQEMLKTDNITNVYDLSNQVPGLTQCCSAHFDNKAGDFMRGVKGLQTYISGVPVPYATSMATPFFDIDNIQVLKGPQGTLFGGSTDSGSILYEPKKPANSFEGYVLAGIGDYGHQEIEGVVNLPLIPDKLFIRLGGQKYDTDGYVFEPSQGKFENDVHYWQARGSVTFRPFDSLQNDTLVNYYSFHNNTDQYVMYYFDPHGLAAQINPVWLADWVKQIPLGYYSVVPNPLPGGTFAKQEQWVVINTTNWDVSDNVTVKNIAGYVETRLADDYHSLPDGLFLDTVTVLPNGTHVSPGAIGGAGGPTVQYSEELQVFGKLFDDRLSYVVGTFNSWYGQRSPRTPNYSITLLSITGNASATTERTNALYTQETFDLSDFVPGLSFTGGYRYTWDRQQQSNLTYSDTTALLFTQGFSGSFHGPSYTLSLDYQVTPGTMLYVTDSKGFQTGGFNAGPGNFGLPPAYQTFNPESLDNIEVGIKSDFDLLGVKSRVNLSGFYGFYDNIQTTLTIQYVNTVTGQPNVTSVTQNAATGHISGFDGEFTVVPMDGLQVYLGFEYLHDKFDQYPSPLQGDLSGAPFIMTPKWKYVLRGMYRLPVLPTDGSLGDLTFRPSWTWQSGVVDAQELNAPRGDRTGEFGTLNASLSWHDVMGRHGLDATAYATNLLDNPVAVGGLPVFATLGLTAVSVPPPRMWGATLRYAFGP